MDGMRLEVFGRLGGDPELQYTPSGKLVTSPSVAVSSGYGESKKTEWVKCTFWEKSADLFGKLAKKGTYVWVSGTPKIETWESDGKSNARMVITVREFKILSGGRPKDEEEEGDNPYDNE